MNGWGDGLGSGGLNRLREWARRFPPFEFRWITVDADNEVLFFIAQDRQRPFPCHKNHQGPKRSDGLADGAIYV